MNPVLSNIKTGNRISHNCLKKRSATSCQPTSFNLSSGKSSMNSKSSYISNGYISCSNLNWLRDMINLKELVSNGVDLSASTSTMNWAEPISRMYNLRQLQLSDCRISSPIPVNQLINLTHLYYLQMGSNFLASSIPIQLANLTSLSSLDLTNSHLHGPITYFPQLQELYVNDNPMPPSISFPFLLSQCCTYKRF
ncbi:leucine-rich repeat receptor-like serine/threonine-protein kinase At1g17230 [Magnolia sinica]|uniref:leucine-rich repeat receptor-like serine/threonine-protein kinase At1g17230 n=1 Tax=Magnolia sinica TaxID=86752 RepID=UPI00265AF6EE|nr:leucine-rich repeat receptor-like serine/threonine-protein kinase At1g17230 [Magnolia sinica]